MRLSRLVAVMLLALGPLLAPHAAVGQTPGHVPRVGIILLGGPYHVLVDGLRQGLRDSMVTSQGDLIIDAARVKKLPTMFSEYSLVAKGALASYGQSFHEIGRMTAKQVQRILAGTPPKDLPVENYDRIEFALNLRTAREIGLTIPPAVRARADKVIE